MTRHDDRPRTEATDPAGAPSDTAIAVDRLVTNGLKALADYEALGQEQVDHIVKKASVAALDQHTALARLAVEETGRRHAEAHAHGVLRRWGRPAGVGAPDGNRWRDTGPGPQHPRF